MPRKKKPDKGKKGRSSQPKPADKLPDRRAMEDMLQSLLHSLHGDAPNTPLGKAQSLMHQAFKERRPARRVELAQQALTICPDCADAYVVLAEHSTSRKAALELYQQGVAAGERALGSEAFTRDVGHFWGILDTRPYMRARVGLAHALWTAPRRDEAVQHLQDMLRLNRNDNQGLRYTLASFLLFLDRDEELGRLMERYHEDSATWAFTKALLSFRREGDTDAARQLLKVARQTNPHVEKYLLGNERPPAERPDYYSPGADTEAVIYANGFLLGWRSTAGAVAWLRANIPSAAKEEEPHPKGPLGFIKKWLQTHLPSEFDVWQAAARQMPTWIRIAGEPIRPWTITVLSRSTDFILANQVSMDKPVPALIWDVLVQAMKGPEGAEPHRPTQLEIVADENWDTLKPHLEEIGVGVAEVPRLEQLEKVFRRMGKEMFGKPRPALLDVPNMKPEQLGSFYAAAASFYRQAPWKQIGYESALRIECDRVQSGPWYVVVMGLSGLTIGLALYEDLEALEHMWRTNDEDEETARATAGTSVTFEEEWDLPVADVEAIRRHGWEIARPDAYPVVFHKERGLAMRPPLVWELELLDGCLRTIPDFIRRRRQDDPTRETMTVQVGAGPMTLVLSWVPQDDVAAS